MPEQVIIFLLGNKSPDKRPGYEKPEDNSYGPCQDDVNDRRQDLVVAAQHIPDREPYGDSEHTVKKHGNNTVSYRYIQGTAIYEMNDRCLACG
jgi:hypothetical protein